jgi:hypothetical protein
MIILSLLAHIYRVIVDDFDVVIVHRNSTFPATQIPVQSALYKPFL